MTMLTAKQINAKITKAIKATNGMKEAIQEALQASIDHAYEHGDVSLLNRLFSEMPKGVQMEKLKQYTLACAPIRVNKTALQEAKGMFAYKATKDEEEMTAKYRVLAQSPWYDYQPKDSDKPKAEVSTASIFANSLKSLVKKLQEHTDLNDLEITALNALKEAVASRQG